MEIITENIKINLTEEEKKAIKKACEIIADIRSIMKENDYEYFRTGNSCANLQSIINTQYQLERMLNADGKFEIEK